LPRCFDPRPLRGDRRQALSQSRLGWAAQTVGETCYESNGRPRRYSARCERRYSWGTAREDYVLPEAHTVAIRIAPQQLGGVECTWSWRARKAGGKTESKRIACTDKLTIARVPYALDRSPVWRVGDGQAARWARARRTGRGGRGPLHRGSRRF